MPKALRASSSASGNGLQGTHVNHLLSVGHSLHEQSQALSTRCLERAFAVRYKHNHAIVCKHHPALPATSPSMRDQLRIRVLLLRDL